MITDIVLRNFRNYQNLNALFSSKVNVFTGDNGQGKTNLLEAIFFLGLLRSFRTSTLRDLNKIGSEGFYLSASIDSEKGWEQLLEIDYSEKRRLRIDGVPVRKASEFIGHLKVVVFAPTDIMLINNRSSLRRRFINMMLSSIYPSYLTALNEYSSALKMRNALLKGSRDISAIEAFEQILARNGAVVVNKRNSVLADLSDEMQLLLKDLCEDIDEFKIKHTFSSTTSSEEEYLSKFASERKKDIARGYSTFGPHVDDFDFLLNSKSLRHFGSTGQCRLVALCLKMAAVSIMDAENRDHSRVITLVDDVTGDLDEKTRNTFFRVIDKSKQTFFTFTESPKEDFFKDAAMFSIADGQLISQ